MTLEEFLNGSIFQYFMVFARIGGAIMLVPGYGEAYVPPRSRLALAMTISLVLLPAVVDRVPPMPATLDRFFLLLVGELGIGVFFGTITRIILSATQTAGTILALQIGIANAQVQNAVTAEQGAVPGNFLMALCLCMIFVTGLDQMTLKSLIGTYALMPPGVWPPMGDVSDYISHAVSDSFLLSLQLAAPFLIYGLIFSLALGLLARLMPALQVFFIATPLQLMGGLSLFAISLSTGVLWFLNSYESHLSSFMGTLR